MKKNPIFQDRSRQSRSIVKRSLTTALPKHIVKRANYKDNKESEKTETPSVIPPIDPIVFYLENKQTPKVVKYNIKRLNNSTLVFKSDNGMLKCKFDPANTGISKSNKSFSNYTQENSDQLILSTENSLHDFYSQSIRLQNLIKKKDKERKLDFASFCNMSYKLSAINKNIVKEQTRIARSFYSM